MLGGQSFARPLFQTHQEECHSKIECTVLSVVSVFPDWPAGFTRNEEPEGSGIVLSDGQLIATADHVLGPAKSSRIRTFDGEVLDAEIIMRDPQTDIAFLRIEKTLPYFTFKQNVVLGSKACAVGNSFGLDISLTCGVISATQVSGVGFNRIEDFIQTDAAVNPGMSGGALVDENGALVGMVSAIFTRQSDANIGINFAVSTQLLKRVLNDFENDGTLKYLKSGILVRPSKPIKNDAGLGNYIGSEVVRVEANSFEDKAGVLVGDVILFAGERRIKRAGAYETAVALLGDDKSLELDILRHDKNISMTVNYE